MFPHLNCLTVPVPAVTLENDPLAVLQTKLEQAVDEAQKETAAFIEKMKPKRSDALDKLKGLKQMDRFCSWYNSEDHKALLKEPGHERLLKLRGEVISMSTKADPSLLDALGDLLGIGNEEVDNPVHDFYTDLPEHARG